VKTSYRIFATVRLCLVSFLLLSSLLVFFSFGRITFSSQWLPLDVVALLVLIEEIIAFILGRATYWRDMFTEPVESALPAIVFESDRTFVEVLCAVAAAILAIALGETAASSLVPAKITLTACVLACFAYLNLQGASVSEDSDDAGKHLIKLVSNRSTVLLMLRNFVYWTFLYGLTCAVIKPQ
jgi:hypothetical protein